MKLSLWPLTLIIYTSWSLKDWEWGDCWGPVIFIRPEHRGDLGIEAHELTHSAMWWEFLGIGYLVLYFLHKRSRFAFEVVAYRAQLACAQYPEQQRGVYAQLLVDRYNLGITYDEAFAALT